MSVYQFLPPEVDKARSLSEHQRLWINCIYASVSRIYVEHATYFKRIFLIILKGVQGSEIFTALLELLVDGV